MYVPFITIVLKVTKLDLQTVITDPGTLAALQVSSSKLDANINLGAATALGEMMWIVTHSGTFLSNFMNNQSIISVRL